MSKSRISLLSCDIDYTESLRTKLLEVLPNEKAGITSLMTAFEKLDRLSNKLSRETREGGVTAKYVCADLNRSHSGLGKHMHATYAVTDDGMDVKIDLTVQHSDADKIIAVIIAVLID